MRKHYKSTNLKKKRKQHCKSTKINFLKIKKRKAVDYQTIGYTKVNFAGNPNDKAICSYSSMSSEYRYMVRSLKE